MEREHKKAENFIDKFPEDIVSKFPIEGKREWNRLALYFVKYYRKKSNMMKAAYFEAKTILINTEFEGVATQSNRSESTAGMLSNTTNIESVSSMQENIDIYEKTQSVSSSEKLLPEEKPVDVEKEINKFNGKSPFRIAVEQEVKKIEEYLTWWKDSTFFVDHRSKIQKAVNEINHILKDKTTESHHFDNNLYTAVSKAFIHKEYKLFCGANFNGFGDILKNKDNKYEDKIVKNKVLIKIAEDTKQTITCYKNRQELREGSLRVIIKDEVLKEIRKERYEVNENLMEKNKEYAEKINKLEQRVFSSENTGDNNKRNMEKKIVALEGENEKLNEEIVTLNKEMKEFKAFMQQYKKDNEKLPAMGSSKHTIHGKSGINQNVDKSDVTTNGSSYDI